jgi:NADH-quinone oxidoreductase subunit J
MERIFFYIFAFIIIVFALASVMSRKILRAVVYLLFSLLGIAALYFLMDYNFLAAVQMAVYAGGIIILFIFSVLLVHHIEGELEEPTTIRKILMGLASLLGFGVVVSVIWMHDFVTVDVPRKSTEVSEIGKGLLSYGDGGFILPFEVISILLLAAMIGAIIISKGNKNV